MSPRTERQRLDRRIVAFAEGRHDVATTDELRELGLSDSAIAVRVSAGWLHPQHRGVYSIGRRAMTRQGRWLAAVLACGPDATLSHRSAAALWGLAQSEGRQIDVTIGTRNGRRRRPTIAIHRPRAGLTADERTIEAGVPVTSVARTLLDLAAVVRPRHLERAVERAEQLRIFDLSQVEAVIAAHRSRRTTGRLVRALSAWNPVPTRSELERMFLSMCEEHGVPRPQVNAEVAGLTVDFSWPGTGLVVETDGFATHGTRTAFERDRTRDATLALAGYDTQRFSYRQIAVQNDVVAATVRARLRRLAREGARHRNASGAT